MNFIINKEEYLSVIAAWNKIPNRDAKDHIFYNVLRGHPIERGFHPTQKEQKLSNGREPWQALTQAKADARWAIRDISAWGNETPERKAKREEEYKDRMVAISKKFGTAFTPELIAKLKEVLA